MHGIIAFSVIIFQGIRRVDIHERGQPLYSLMCVLSAEEREFGMVQARRSLECTITGVDSSTITVTVEEFRHFVSVG